MGYYNVIRPCVVGKLHYASIPSQPILVDDEVAAPLVQSGELVAYEPRGAVELKGSAVVDLEGSVLSKALTEAGVHLASPLSVTPDTDNTAPKRPRRPRAAE